MPLKAIARYVRDVVLPRERLRLAFPHAHIAPSLAFSGDVARTSLGDGVTLSGPAVVSVTNGGGLTGATLSIGDRTYVGEFNNIRCAGARIEIGSDCLISQFVTLVGSNHGTERGTPIARQPWSGDGVVIGDDVWLGAGVTVLPGARIGSGVVVAANSVVRGAIEPGTIVGGTPARVLGSR
ncbi:acyltransferase [Agilicoccus flavus]|uniref:acyltransferase n=1 Tax=Agilicoccus flavus TaxID=2775968 RepID=UPI001CF64119|nr:acyltransferase [Agilicoccus flavus]